MHPPSPTVAPGLLGRARKRDDLEVVAKRRIVENALERVVPSPVIESALRRRAENDDDLRRVEIQEAGTVGSGACLPR